MKALNAKSPAEPLAQALLRGPDLTVRSIKTQICAQFALAPAAAKQAIAHRLRVPAIRCLRNASLQTCAIFP